MKCPNCKTHMDPVATDSGDGNGKNLFFCSDCGQTLLYRPDPIEIARQIKSLAKEGCDVLDTNAQEECAQDLMIPILYWNI